LPKDEGVPKLIEIAQNNRNPAVRKQAMFWLGQSNDPRRAGNSLKKCCRSEALAQYIFEMYSRIQSSNRDISHDWACSESPHFAPVGCETAREPGTTIASSGIISGSVSVAV